MVAIDVGGCVLDKQLGSRVDIAHTPYAEYATIIGNAVIDYDMTLMIRSHIVARSCTLDRAERHSTNRGTLLRVEHDRILATSIQDNVIVRNSDTSCHIELGYARSRKFGRPEHLAALGTDTLLNTCRLGLLQSPLTAGYTVLSDHRKFLRLIGRAPERRSSGIGNDLCVGRNHNLSKDILQLLEVDERSSCARLVDHSRQTQRRNCEALDIASRALSQRSLDRPFALLLLLVGQRYLIGLSQVDSGQFRLQRSIVVEVELHPNLLIVLQLLNVVRLNGQRIGNLDRNYTFLVVDLTREARSISRMIAVPSGIDRQIVDTLVGLCRKQHLRLLARRERKHDGQ